MNTDQPVALTADEVAKLLRVDRKTVYAAYHANLLPGRRLGRAIRFSREAVLRWLDEKTTHPQEA
ncbi:MAG: helix-turn-helix domain-containing protein [Deltaproteobacteria bacterium]|nr:helix-turn-helix domain-containing protein [Deltaproteobacteria bacterium]